MLACANGGKLPQSIFSTDIVQIPVKQQQENSRLIFVDRAVWVYLASSVVLTFITVGAVVFWNTHRLGTCINNLRLRRKMVDFSNGKNGS